MVNNLNSFKHIHMMNSSNLSNTNDIDNNENSSVIFTISNDTNINLLGYGHRRNGQPSVRNGTGHKRNGDWRCR